VVKQVDEVLGRLLAAEASTVTFREQYNEANSQAQALLEEKKVLKGQIKTYQTQLVQFEKKAQEDL